MTAKSAKKNAVTSQFWFNFDLLSSFELYAEGVPAANVLTNNAFASLDSSQFDTFP